MDMMANRPSREDLAELVEGASAGDQAAFGRLYRMHADYVKRVVKGILSSADAEDVVQETFVAAFQGLDGLADKAALRGWLRTIAVRSSMKMLRKRYARREELCGMSLREEPKTDSAQEAFALELYGALRELPSELRQPWVSMRIEGMTFANVAQEFSLSESTVKRRIRHADERLRRRVTPMNGPHSPAQAH